MLDTHASHADFPTARGDGEPLFPRTTLGQPVQVGPVPAYKVDLRDVSNNMRKRNCMKTPNLARVGRHGLFKQDVGGFCVT